MGGRALRPLACTRLPLTRPPRLSGRCRFYAVAITHLHIHTVRPTTDRPDPPTCPTQRVVAARASSVRDQVPPPAVHGHHAHPFVSTRCAVCSQNSMSRWWNLTV